MTVGVAHTVVYTSTTMTVVPFVKAGSESKDDRALAGKNNKTDLELEEERQEARRRDEEASFRDVSRLAIIVRGYD